MKLIEAVEPRNTRFTGRTVATLEGYVHYQVKGTPSHKKEMSKEKRYKRYLREKKEFEGD